MKLINKIKIMVENEIDQKSVILSSNVTRLIEFANRVYLHRNIIKNINEEATKFSIEVSDLRGKYVKFIWNTHDRIDIIKVEDQYFEDGYIVLIGSGFRREVNKESGYARKELKDRTDMKFSIHVCNFLTPSYNFKVLSEEEYKEEKKLFNNEFNNYFNGFSYIQES